MKPDFFSWSTKRKSTKSLALGLPASLATQYVAEDPGASETYAMLTLCTALNVEARKISSDSEGEGCQECGCEKSRCDCFSVHHSALRFCPSHLLICRLGYAMPFESAK